MELQFPAMDPVSILPFIFCGRVHHMYLSGQLSSEAVAEKVSVAVFLLVVFSHLQRVFVFQLTW